MLRITLLLVVLCLLGTGCTVNEVIVADETELVVAQAPVEESRLLDIGRPESAASWSARALDRSPEFESLPLWPRESARHSRPSCSPTPVSRQSPRVRMRPVGYVQRSTRVAGKSMLRGTRSGWPVSNSCLNLWRSL